MRGAASHGRWSNITGVEWPQRRLVRGRGAPVQGRNPEFAGPLQPLVVQTPVEQWTEGGVDVSQQETVSLDVSGNWYVETVAKLADHVGEPTDGEDARHPEERVGQAAAAAERAGRGFGVVFYVVGFFL